MPAEPPVKRGISFFDGQNLYHAVRMAFGYTYPNYGVKPLAQSLCTARGWRIKHAHHRLICIRFVLV